MYCSIVYTYPSPTLLFLSFEIFFISFFIYFFIYFFYIFIFIFFCINYLIKINICISVCWSCFASGVLFYFVDRTKSMLHERGRGGREGKETEEKGKGKGKDESSINFSPSVYTEYSENVFDAVELKDVSEVSENPSLSRSSLSNGEEEDIYGYDSLPLERKRDMRRVPECGEERKAEAEVEGGTTLSATLVSTTSTTEADDMEQLVLERGRDEKEAGDGDRREKTQEGSSVKKLIAVVMTVVNTVRGFPITYWLVLSLMVIFTCDLYTTTAFLTKYLYPALLSSPLLSSPRLVFPHFLLFLSIFFPALPRCSPIPSGC